MFGGGIKVAAGLLTMSNIEKYSNTENKRETSTEKSNRNMQEMPVVFPMKFLLFFFYTGSFVLSMVTV